MSPKLSRLLFVASLAVGFGFAPMLVAQAGTSGIDVSNNQFGTGALDVYKNDTVNWYIKDGTHTVTPANDHPGGQKWSAEPSGDLEAGSQFTVTFTKGGKYYYFCERHENMTGVINVIDPSATTTTTAPSTTTTPPTTPTTTPSTTVTTARGSTPPATTATVPTTRATPTTAAPTTTTNGKADKDKKGNKDETTTTTVPPLTPPPPPIDLPDEAIIPSLPGASTPASAEPGPPGVAPTDTPEGEAVALLKGKKNGGGDAMKLLIVSGLGLGALGIGSAGYKYANRSSKYFPA